MTAHTSKRRTRLAGAALLITAALTLSSCAVGGAANFADGFSVQGAVSQLPAQESKNYLVTVGDPQQAFTLAGIEPGDDEALRLYAGTHDTGVYLPADVMLGNAKSQEDALGWDLMDVTRYATVTAPPDMFTVVAGDVSLPQGLDEVAPGVVSDSTADDYASDMQRADLIDQLRRPTRFAEHNGLVALTLSTKAASSWSSGEGKSLADNKSVAAVASALDKSKVYAAMITQPAKFSGRTLLGPHASDAQAEAAEKEYGSMVPPKPYDVVGVGWTGVGDSEKWIAAYHFGSEADAKDGAQVLKGVWEAGSSVMGNTPFSDMVSVDSVTIDAQTVVVTLTPKEGVNNTTLASMLGSLEIVFASR